MRVTWSGSAPRLISRASIFSQMPDSSNAAIARGQGNDIIRSGNGNRGRSDFKWRKRSSAGVDAVNKLNDRRVRWIGTEVDQQSRFKHIKAHDQHRRAINHAQDFIEVNAVVIGHLGVHRLATIAASWLFSLLLPLAGGDAEGRGGEVGANGPLSRFATAPLRGEQMGSAMDEHHRFAIRRANRLGSSLWTRRESVQCWRD